MGPGERIAGRFVVEEMIGSGGMGTVYRALDRASRKTVAIKILRGRNEEDVRRFDREVAVLEQLDHPALLTYLTHGELGGGIPYLVTPWIAGPTLAHLLEHSGINVAQSIRLVRTLAEALSTVHEAGLIHRDIKPTNILLENGEADRPKLIDFGLARWTRDNLSRMTHTGIAVGTPGYMSPEQVRGGHDADARSDVFQLGCVLYECLTGRPAFGGSTPIAAMTNVIIAEPPPVSAFRSDVPADLQLLTERMLAKTPEIRPADGRVLVHAIDRLGPISATAMRKALGENLGEATWFPTELPTVALRGSGLFVVLAANLVEQNSTVPRAAVVALSELGASVEQFEGAVIAAVFPSEPPLLAKGVAALSTHWPDASVGLSLMETKDQFGEVVEAASRALSMGASGRVVIAPAAERLLRDAGVTIKDAIISEKIEQ